MTIRRTRKSGKTGSKSSFLGVQQKRDRFQKRRMLLENLEDRRVMAVGPDLVSIQPNNSSLLTNNATLRVAPRELVFNFTNQDGFALDPTTLNAILLRRSGFDGDFTNGSVTITPGFIGLGDTGNEVIMRFANPLPDDAYRIILLGAGTGPVLRDVATNPLNGGQNEIVNFDLDLGAQVLSVVPQPVGLGANGALSQRMKDIDVYFNDDDLNETSAENINFYQLIITGNTVTPTDDAAAGNVIKPVSVVYDRVQNKATLTFDKQLHLLNPNNYAMRLRIGTNEGLDGATYNPIAAGDPLSTYAGALQVGPLNGNVVYADSISAKPYDIAWPGGNDDPGHRDTPRENEQHLNDGQTDGLNGITTQYYNFRRFLGTVSDGRGGQRPSFNDITENQKQRAREVFELYSRYAGIQFIESQDLGLTVATGELQVVDPEIPSAPGGVAGLGGGPIAIMDIAENWNDGYGENWFRVAMHEIGHSLGLGHTYDLAPLTIMGDDGQLVGQSPFPEGVYPGDSDIVHMQRIHRPEGQDIDMYRFTIAAGQTGVFSAETFAERLQNSSFLDTYLRLYKQGPDGPELIAINDDYFSKDSLIQTQLGAGTYFIGVTAKGNEQYDPVTIDSGMGGTTQGAYRLSLNFRPNISAANSIIDETGTLLDGDSNGTPGGAFNFWFKTAAPIPQAATSHTTPVTLFVNRLAPNGGNGSLARPFNNIETALSRATVAGDIVRIVGNGGADGNFLTQGDNLAYQIGFDQVNNAPLRDGSELVVPKNVTVMIDAGATFQMRRSRIQVGSTQLTGATDRSGGALQVLGIPGRSVFFTSFNDASIGKDENPQTFLPQSGDWGGILFRADQDRADGRFDWEERGIFLNTVNFADMRYGGGRVSLGGGQQAVINPVHMVDTRPTITNNIITLSADAAMSATPNSFWETNFREPRFQPDGTYARSFNVDYARIGPEIHGNTLAVVRGGRVDQNTLNGIFVRARTPAGSTLQELTVTGRFDDTDIVHIVAENLIIAGSPSGPTYEGGTPTPNDPTINDAKPPVNLVIVTTTGNGTLGPGTYRYRIVNVDRFGNEGRASDVIQVTIGGSGRSVQLSQLPAVPAGSSFVGRRIYRLDPTSTVYTFVDQVPASVNTFTDRGARPTFDRILNPSLLTGDNTEAFPLHRPRPDASLKVDPNIVVKLDASRIEVGMGATMIAEGLDGQEIIFTSLSDDRFGAGGTFDTRGDVNANPPNNAEWGGIYAGPHSRLSLDQTSIFYGGGLTRVEGDFASFNAVEIQQADARVANTLFQFNGDGTGGTAPAERFGRGTNGTASIFVRGAQPVIIDNVIRDNFGAAMNINVNALNSNLVVDSGRQSGLVDRLQGHLDNHGPLINGNRLANNGPIDAEGWNGMIVRGGLLTTEGVWDDTDIAHIVFDRVSVTDMHTFGGLRLESSPTESLVVKSFTLDVNSPAGFYVNGRPLETDDRIGGILQVLGQPGFPVVMTSYRDDSASAGLMPDGSPMFDTNNDGSVAAPAASPFADVIVVMDESGSMGFAQQFSAQFIQDLEAGLTAANIGTVAGPNQYGLFGFGGGGTIDAGHVIPVGPGGAVYGTAQEYAAATSQLVVSGAFEDGYRAIELMTPNYPTRINAAKFVILVTNEDRDVGDPNFTFGTTLTTLQNAGFRLQGILGTQIVDQNNQRALALDSLLNAYSDDGAGSFTVSPNGRFLPGFDTSVQDYGNLVHALGGIAGDINQISSSQQTANIFSQVLVASLVAQAGGGTRAGAGDWEGIIVDKYAHDRNVDTILEQEDSSTGQAQNNTPLRAQDLGLLAPAEKGGDENRRLGYTIHGNLSVANDIDVYSFRADAGTQIWVDIDRTSSALDTVVEVIDSDGSVIARSNDSHLEALGTQGLIGAGREMQAFPPFQGRDFFTTNVRDAGMRLVLPGPAGTNSEYFLRVRSGSSNVSNLNGGITSGSYQLQLRLQEKDEHGGTVVRYSDIRFATNGIEVRGQPIHSPLAGEHMDVDQNNGNNDFRTNAQIIGNALNVDRGASSIAGFLNRNDVDWYEFNVNIDKIQGFGADELLYSMMFDLDYADGLGRANAVLSLFNSDGELIFTNRDSNVADDQPAPLDAAGLRDLLRGSVGVADPMIGPIYLPAGSGGVFPGAPVQTYYVAVSTDARLPSQWGQFFQRTPANALVRFQPIDSVHRIVEDHIGEGTGFLAPRGTADLPDVQVFLDPNSTVPFNLGDVTLFVERHGFTTGRNGTFGSDLVTVDPFTGGAETFVGFQSQQELQDIAFRNDEELFAFSQGLRRGSPTSDANSGHFIQVSTGNGAVLSDTDDAMTTFELVPGNNPGVDPNTLAVSHNVGTRIGWGVQYEALMFADLANDSAEELLAVGNRGDAPRGGGVFPGDNPSRNLVYNLDPQTGVPVQNNGPTINFNPQVNPPGWVGALTSGFEVGVIDTTPAGTGGLDGDITGIARVGGVNWAVDDQGGLYTFTANINANLNLSNTTPAKVRQVTTDYIEESRFDLEGIEFQALTKGPADVEGGRYANMLFAAGRRIGAPFNEGYRLYAIGTQGAELGRLQPIFENGATSIQLMYREPDSTFAQPLTEVKGLAFSNLDENLWHITTERDFGGDNINDERQLQAGHGMRPTIDGSVVFPQTDPDNVEATPGEFSYYFGDPEQRAQQRKVKGVSTYDAAGGAYGSIVSNEFSLAGYSSADQPVLYYTYFLASEEVYDNAADFPDPNRAADRFRQLRDTINVYVAGNDGDWQLIGGDADERWIEPPVDANSPSAALGARMFDTTGSWRQVRINLGDFAGEDNLRVRFDFSTAGEMNVGDLDTTGTELRAVAGRFISDGEFFTVDGQRFEFDSGVTIVTSPGSQFFQNQSFDLRWNGVTETFVFDRNGTAVGPHIIPVTGFETATEMATKIKTAIENAFPALPPGAVRHLGDNRLGLDFLDDQATDGISEAVTGIALEGNVGITAGNIRVPVSRNLTRDVVAQRMDAVLEPFLSQETLLVAGNEPAFNDMDTFQLAVGNDVFNFEIEKPGLPGVINFGFEPVFVNSGDDAADIAQAIHQAISNVLTGARTATYNAADRARVQLNGVRTERFSLSANPNGLPIQVIAPVDLVKVDGDLVRIINHTVTNASAIGFDDSLDGDYLPFEIDEGFESNRRGQNNDFEGVYIDDIIIGLAERGEMVTGAVNDTNYIDNAALQPNETLAGSYQLEIRRGPDYALADADIGDSDGDFQASPIRFPVQTGSAGIDREPSVPTFNTNDRLNESTHIVAPSGDDIRDGRTFTLSDSINQVTFEFDVNGSVAQGNFGIVFDPNDTAAEIAQKVRDAINSPAVQAVLNASAQIADGTRGTQFSTNNRVNIVGASSFDSLLTLAPETNDVRSEATVLNLTQRTSHVIDATIGDNPSLTVPGEDVDLFRVQLNAGQTIFIDVDRITGGFDSYLRIFDSSMQVRVNDDAAAPGESPSTDSYIQFTPTVGGTYYIGVSGKGNEVYNPGTGGNRNNGSTGRYRLEVSRSQTGDAQIVQINDSRYGDDNLFRDQGQLILEGNRISTSANWGILVNDGARDNGTAPHNGPARALREPNRLVPGIVISNNIIYDNVSGGIRFSGALNAAGVEVGSVPFGRLINNTLFGRGGNLLTPRGNDVGIQVDENASPTMLNNIVANFSTGIQVDASSAAAGTVVGGSLYQGNVNNVSGIGQGANAIVLANTAPLFVDPARGNFYLLPGSRAIDSSVDSLLDRPVMVTTRNPLGIPPSPILAPEKDASGQGRVDDPAASGQGGTGENPFKDRGALDRSDFSGPRAALTNPEDNDAAGVDGDPTVSRISIGNISLFNFVIQLTDGGIGVDDTSVVSQAVRLEVSSGGPYQLLSPGADYNFSYDTTNNRIVLTPTSIVWTTARNYRITVDNSITDGSAGIAIRDIAGNLLAPNRGNGTVVFDIFVGTSVDWGDAPATFPVLRADNGASHDIRGSLKLGTQISTESNGQPSPLADADTFDDGLGATYNISPGIQSFINVLAQGTGTLDAWLDMNKNGRWEASEKLVFTNGATIGGGVSRQLRFTFGNTNDVKGDTALRLRYSSAGIGTPTGPAPDGEVEDYIVTMTGPRFQNPNNRFDVDGNGFVQNRDALIVINIVQNFDLDGDGVVNPFTDLPPSLQNPPPYADVDGNGVITRNDAQAVVNELNNPSSSPSAAALGSTSSGSTYASSSIVYEQKKSTATAAPAKSLDAVYAALVSEPTANKKTTSTAPAKSTKSTTASASPKKVADTQNLVDDFFSKF